jgi:hypothetical protein
MAEGDKEYKVPNTSDHDQVLIVTVGSEDRPASEKDITAIQEGLSQISEDKGLTFVTHHALHFQLLPRTAFDGEILAAPKTGVSPETGSE